MSYCIALHTCVWLLPEWMSKCVFKFEARLNNLPQLYNLSWEWVSKCLFKCPAFANDLLQCAHLCNFSPVWIIMWRLDNQIWMNFRKTSKGGGGVFKSGYPSVPKMTKTNKHLLHCMHLCDFFPVWNERICNYSDFQLGQILSCIDQFSTAVGRH